MGIFSASHRQLAKEAFACVLRRITFRPCNVSFQEKAKGKILGWLLRKSPFLAKFFNKYFEVLSWIFFVLMMGSFAYGAYGAYNFYIYGSCNGPNSSGFCVFDPAGSSNKASTLDTKCYLNKPTEKDLDFSKLDLKDFPQRLNGASNNIIFVGCYACDYTRKAYPIIKNLLSKYNSNFTFVHFPVKAETTYLLNYDYCVYKESPDKYWQYQSTLFNLDKYLLIDEPAIGNVLKELGFNADKIKKCVLGSEAKSATAKRLDEIGNVGIYGTPTIWINGKIFVGPKPERVYRRALVK